jgi:hypothetical protein
MRKIFVLFVVGALFLVAALFLRGAASAAGPSVGATDATVAPGEQGSSQLFTHGMAAPGLGAWTIDVRYDPDVITVTGCTPVSQTSVCNPNYAAGVVRSAGANAQGLDGDPILAEIQFRCADAEGGTTLAVRPHDVSDATIGGPQLMTVGLSNGVVRCEESTVAAPATPTPVPGVPHAGFGSDPGAPNWARVAAALLGVLVAGLVLFSAGARAFPRRVD